MSEEAKRNATLETIRGVEEILRWFDDKNLRRGLESFCSAVRDCGGEIPENLSIQMLLWASRDLQASGCAANPPRKAA